MNIFKEIFLSFEVGQYKNFIRHGKGRILLYVFTVSLLSLIFTLLPFVVNLQIGGGFEKAVSERVPDFKIEKGKIWVERKYIQDLPEEGLFLYVDTDKAFDRKKYDMDSILEKYAYVFIVDEEGVISKSSGRVADVKIRDLDPNMSISREDLKQMKSYFYLALFVGSLIVYFFSVLGYLFSAWIFALIAIMIAMALNVKMRFKTLYKVCIYAKTPLLLLSILKALIGLRIPYFFMIGAALTLGYIVMALSRLRKEAQEAALSTRWNTEGAFWYDEERRSGNEQRYRGSSDEDAFSMLPKRSHETEIYSSREQESYSSRENLQSAYPNLQAADRQEEREDLEGEREKEKEQKGDLRPSDTWSFFSESAVKSQEPAELKKEEESGQEKGFGA